MRCLPSQTCFQIKPVPEISKASYACNNTYIDSGRLRRFPAYRILPRMSRLDTELLLSETLLILTDL